MAAGALTAGALAGCGNNAERPGSVANHRSESADVAEAELPRAGTPPATLSSSLPPLPGVWLERLGEAETSLVVTPPVGAVTPRRLIVAVHGAGDRPEWSCGGWRVAAQPSAFVACPRGSLMTRDKFAWVSAQQLQERVEAGVRAVQARFGPYVDDGPFIFAGFSQGATLAEPFLRRNAARFPIAILAEGGYPTSRSSAFATAFFASGGRRVVLVCGTPGCFRSALEAKSVLASSGLEVLVVGDAKAGHNLNQRMQLALRQAWPEISAPLPAR